MAVYGPVRHQKNIIWTSAIEYTMTNSYHIEIDYTMTYSSDSKTTLGRRWSSGVRIVGPTSEPNVGPS